jgi:hypothetical protein
MFIQDKMQTPIQTATPLPPFNTLLPNAAEVVIPKTPDQLVAERLVKQPDAENFPSYLTDLCSRWQLIAGHENNTTSVAIQQPLSPTGGESTFTRTSYIENSSLGSHNGTLKVQEVGVVKQGVATEETVGSAVVLEIVSGKDDPANLLQETKTKRVFISKDSITIKDAQGLSVTLRVSGSSGKLILQSPTGKADIESMGIPIPEFLKHHGVLR